MAQLGRHSDSQQREEEQVNLRGGRALVQEESQTTTKQ